MTSTTLEKNLVVAFKPMTPRIRARKNGKHILCPNCYSISKVYHFSWSSLHCNHCEEYIDKQLWSVEV